VQLIDIVLLSKNYANREDVSALGNTKPSAPARIFKNAGTLREVLPMEKRDAMKGPAQVSVKTGFALVSQSFLCFHHRRECSRSRGLYF